MDQAQNSKQVLDLADFLFEKYTLRDLVRRREMLLSLRASNPAIGRLKLFSAIHLALNWKETEEERRYLVH